MKVFRPLYFFTFLFTAWCLTAGASMGNAGDLQVEAKLIWGTNDETSPNPKHKQVQGPLARKLGDSFKWKTYFEEERQTASIPENGVQKLKMSPSCVVEIKNLGKDNIQAKLIGEGKPVVINKGPLSGGELVVIGGDAKNDTAWFIVLRKATSK